MKKQCQAFVVSKGERCKRTALRGARYCWLHQPGGFLVASLILGAVLGAVFSLFLSEAWRAIVPSREQRELTALREDYQQSLKAPAFQFFLNDLELFGGSAVVIPTTDATQTLSFAVMNSGNLMAKDMKVSVKFPRPVNDLTASGSWQNQKASLVSDGQIRVLPDQSFVLKAGGTFAQNDTFACDPFFIERRVTSPEGFPVHLRAVAFKSEPHYVPITVTFVPGNGEPFVTSIGRQDKRGVSPRM